MSDATQRCFTDLAGLRQRAELCAKYDFDTVEMIECKWALWDEILEALEDGRAGRPPASALDAPGPSAERYTDYHGNTVPIEQARVLRGAAQTAPDGWKLVPLIPNQSMIEVGCDNNATQWSDGTDRGFPANVANDVYVSMVRAAPQPVDPAYASGMPPGLPAGWTMEAAVKAAWMVNTLAITATDEWRSKNELLVEFRRLAFPSTDGGSAA